MLGEGSYKSGLRSRKRRRACAATSSRSKRRDNDALVLAPKLSDESAGRIGNERRSVECHFAGFASLLPVRLDATSGM